VRWCPWCCGELGGAVEVRKEGREVVAFGAVESWVVLWGGGWPPKPKQAIPLPGHVGRVMLTYHQAV
jgi:hypothetical protein